MQKVRGWVDLWPNGLRYWPKGFNMRSPDIFGLGRFRALSFWGEIRTKFGLNLDENLSIASGGLDGLVVLGKLWDTALSTLLSRGQRSWKLTSGELADPSVLPLVRLETAKLGLYKLPKDRLMPFLSPPALKLPVLRPLPMPHLSLSRAVCAPVMVVPHPCQVASKVWAPNVGTTSLPVSQQGVSTRCRAICCSLEQHSLLRRCTSLENEAMALL